MEWAGDVFGCRSSVEVGGRSGSQCNLCSRLLFEYCPIKDVVVLVVESSTQDSEQLAQVHIIWSFVEAETTTVVEVHCELCRKGFAESFDRSRHLLLADLVILLLLVSRLQTLPWQRSAQEVHHDVTKRLHVVTTRLFDAEVGVDGGVARSSGQRLVLAVGNVRSSATVFVFLRKTEIDDENLQQHSTCSCCKTKKYLCSDGPTLLQC